MNKTFKVIFNQVLGRHVVVSEIAGVIQRGACKAVFAGILAMAGLGLSNQVFATQAAGSLSFGNGSIEVLCAID